MIDPVLLGRRLHELRADRGLPLSALAGTAGVSVSMLSAIERGEKTPTVVVLSRIADGLGLSLSRLLADLETDRVLVRRAAEQEHIAEPGGWHRTVLTPVVPGVNFEWIRTTLPPHCDAGAFPAYAPGSHEFVAVESGVLHLGVGEAEYVLNAGDSLYFPADAPHSYANRDADPCDYHVAALIMRPRGNR
ncbi:transcriptional regulator with XRE-family HTH domain [Amycolatopsis lexingtonensis]|uniref:Transcriptional regulator with XRE-family HTH domain n=1 Tax=Amycolatopsis lexingtonensis TaxID=218822 RepID=A0ABR9HRX5_9PSEU|nr:XRE family transcriptional regulator [Amycolatopsis lexingtonensis]MBE1493678.1 transcriptional regulator with XRE-family HTH domain [Amycolatopsis lexingtonensis]